MHTLGAQAAIDFIDDVLISEIPVIQRLDARERSKVHFFELGPNGKQFAVVVGDFDAQTQRFNEKKTRVLLEEAPPNIADVEPVPEAAYYNGGSVKRSFSRLAPPTQRSVLVGSEAGLRELLRWYLSSPVVPPSVPRPEPVSSSSMKEFSVKKTATNTILFGPPGTGKTYATTSRAVQICDGFLPDGDVVALKGRFELLRQQGRISFVTFHQSYGYEEFVEGLRPVTKEGQVSYEVLPGAFKRACNSARLRSQVSPGLSGKPLRQRTLFKMSLGASWNQEGTTVFDYCIKNSCVLLGWGADIDFSECTSKEEILQKIHDESSTIEKPKSQAGFVNNFKHEMKAGDLILVSNGNKLFRAVAEVVGEYEYAEDAPFHQMREVRWLAVFEGGIPASDLYSLEVVQRSLYELKPEAIRYEKLAALLDSQALQAPEQPHVLIIDEINRANISKVFGELITLIEPDKRDGQENAVTVKLPYSGEDFSVPPNLHILGTMNTADRSIALLDTALRRRFEFEELMPRPDLLESHVVEGINLGKLLKAMNERIEVLYDRDHMIGHAYLMGIQTLPELDRVFRFKVLPLLQEYFYESWTQIRRVLSDLGDGDFVRRRKLDPVPADGEQDFQDEQAVLYSVNPEKFPVSAFKRIYGDIG